MPAKLTLLGIDGMDYEIVLSLMNRLPNLSRIRGEGFLRRLDSVFPPDSDTAWTTIFTGLNPAEHGVVKFVDPLEKSISYQTEETSSATIRGKCIWDKLSDNGARVCVILPHAAFPPWSVNGIMISRSSLTNEVSVTPEGTLSCKKLDGLVAPRGFPGRGKRSLSRYLKASQALFENTTEVALELHDQEDWDFFFMYSPILDIVPHFFWKFHDKGDPAYPGPNTFEDLIPRLYSEHDATIGQFSDRQRRKDLLIILSDHGHGRRPTHEYRLNEMFRRQGLLFTKKSRSTDEADRGRPDLAKIGADLVQKLSLENAVSSLMRHFPTLRNHFIRPSWIDWDKTIAATVDLSGLKSYSYGGIRIKRALCPDPQQYEDVRKKVASVLENATDPCTGAKLALWVKQREAVYSGDFISRYPDLVCQLRPEYGFNPSIGNDIIEESRIRSLVPGTHLGHNAVLAGIGSVDGQEKFRNADINGIMDATLTWLRGKSRETFQP